MSLIIPILIILLLVGLTAIIVIPRIDSIKKWIKKNWKKIIGFILAGSLSAGGLILYDGEDGPPINPPSGWYSSDFGYRRDITIDSSQIDSELTNFPLLVHMDNDSDLQSHAQSDGGDIIFVDTTNTTKFKHEIEWYDSTNGTLWAWVNVTSISADTDTHFNMYYGNDSIGNQWDVANTWDSSYRMVQHLEEEYSADSDHYTDSTSNSNHAEATTNYAGDPYRSEGVIGYACNFSNVDDALVLDAINEDVPITISCWVRTDAYWQLNPDINDGFLTNRGIISRYYASDGIRCGTSGNGSLIGRAKIDDTIFDGNCQYGARPHCWYYCTVIFDHDTITYMVNDTITSEDDASDENDNFNNSAYPWGIGCSTTWTKDTTSTYDFNGTVDEARIINGTRSTDWVNASFRNQNQESGFLTIGMEEPMINSAPNAISGESPTNSSTDIAVNSLVAGIVSDPDGDYLTVTWYSNSEGSWALFGTNTSVVNNTNISQLNSNFSDFSETYYWSMNVTDGEYWNNETFHFTTETPSQTIISQSGESPVNETTDVGLIPYLYVIVSNNNDVSMDVEWWSNSSGSWAQFDSASSVSNNTNITTFNSNFSSKDTTYYWSVNATDGIGNWTNTTYHFTSQTDDWQLKWRNINYDPNIGTPSSYTNPVADDINGDGIYEIFHGHRTYDGSWKSGIVCFNGSTGELNWQKNITTLTGYHIPMAIGDINNDGVKELVHASGTTTTARHGMNGTILWEVAQDSGWGTPAIADTDDNGWPYVYVSSNTGFEGSAATRKLNGTTGALVAISTNTSYTCYGGVSIADLDRDGEFEIVMSDSGDSICYNEDLENLWTTASFSSESHCAVLINCTGDADLEVIMLNQNGADVGPDGMYIYYANGTLWKGDSSIWAADTCHCQPAAYDIDKDGSIEVVIGKLDPPSYPDTVYVFDVDDWDNDTILEKGSEPPDFVNVIGDSDLEILSGGSWVDAYMDIYDSSYDNVDEIGSNPEINWCYGPYFIVQDVDDDGLNELCIFGGGKSATNYHNFSCYDLLTEVNSPQVRTDTTYYSERRQAAGIYIPKIGGKCVLSSESPSDGASDVSTATSTLSVSVDEPDDDPIYWSIETSPDIGSDSGEGDAEGTISCSVSDLAIDTEYTWYVNVSDNVNWKNFVYTFNTSVPEITLSGVSPVNGSTEVGAIPYLYTNIEHSTGDAMDITWWSNSTGSWAQFDSESSVANNTNISGFNSNFSTKNTLYYWSANVTDGAETWKNETYHFTLQSDNHVLKWAANLGSYNFPYSCPLAEDIDGDGIYEVFTATKPTATSSGTTFCLNGSTGGVIWQHDYNTLGDNMQPSVLGQLTNDGVWYLVQVAGTNTICHYATNGTEFWNVSTESGWGCPAIADTDDNGYPYVWISSNTAFPDNNAYTRKLNGTTGAIVAESSNTSYTCYGGVSIADLDRDGEFEIVMSDSGDSICYNEDLENLWTTSSYTSESHCAMLANVTGDEDLEVIICNQDSSSPFTGGIHIYYANGTVWQENSNLGLAFHEQMSVYDIDQDGNLEITSASSAQNSDEKVVDLVTFATDATLRKCAIPSDFLNYMNDTTLELVNTDGDSWYSNTIWIYDANLTHVDTITDGGTWGVEGITQDIDNDGLNEYIIGGGGSGIEITVYDTLATTIGARTDTSFYSERRLMAEEYIPKIGGKCSLSSESPSDDAEDVSISTTTLSIDIDEPDNDLVYWYIETSPDIGSDEGWGESEGTKTCTVSGLSYDTEYTWWINCSDNVNWINTEYTFTTEIEDTGEWYISNDGADSNSGNSEGSPWENISYLNTQINGGVIDPGDDIYFKRGDTFSGEIDLGDGGTVDNWQILGAYGEGDRPIIENSGDMGNGHCIHMGYSTDYHIIEDLHLYDANRGINEAANHTNIIIRNCNGSVFSGGESIFLWKTDTFLIENCTFANGSICLYGDPYNRLSNGRIFNCTVDGGFDELVEDCFTVHRDGSENNAGSNFWFKNCTGFNATENSFDFTAGNNILCEDCTGYGDEEYAVSIGADVRNLTIQDCLFYNKSGYSFLGGGINIGSTEQLIIRNNTVYDSDDLDALRFSTWDAVAKSWDGYNNNQSIYNNNFIYPSDWDDDLTERIASIQDGYFYDIIIKNNIFASFSSEPNVLYIKYGSNGGDVPPSDEFTFNTNMWYHPSGSGANLWDNYSTEMDFDSWDDFYPNDVFDDPEFGDVDSRNLELNSTSLCVDAGDWLAETEGSGNDDVWITLDNASFFMDGYGWVDGDIIFVGSDTDLMIEEVHYHNNTIKVNRSISWVDAENVSLNFYNESKIDIGRWESPHTGVNTAPTIQGESPTNASTNIATTPTLNVTVNDEDDDTMSAKWYSNSSGAWVQFGTENSSLSDGGVIYQTNSNFSDYGTTYYWSVNLTDEEDWCNETYHFETQDDSYAGPNYYVNATSGLDTNNGSLISPWLTITHGMDLIDAGDTLYIMKGNYQEYVSAWGVTANSGTSDNWITYTNYENDDVTIDGSGDNDATDGLIWLINESYIRISGLTFANSSCNGFRADGSLGSGTHNITVDNCTFYNCSASALYFYPGNPAYGYFEDIIIENNTIHDCQNGWNHYPYASDETITISNTTRFWINNNYIYDGHKISIDAKNQVSEGYIYNNRINTTPTRRIIQDDTEWGWINSGIYVDAYDDNANNVSVYNNIIWGNMTGYVIGTEEGGTLTDISFYNNIYNGTGHAFQINNHTNSPGSHLKKDCSFINNVVYGASSCFFITDINSSFENFTIRNFIFDTNQINGGIYIPDKSDKLLLEYQNVDHNIFNVSESSYWGTNEINGTPEFVDPDNGDFNITVNSHAINNGSSVYAPTLDYWGNSRVGLTDIGIHEYDISCGPYSGPDYYVNTTSGDDNNYNGSLIYPFKTIWKAVNESTNGDTIHIMAGTYTPWSGHIDITSKDASSDWLTIQNYLNDVVIVDGTNCPTQYSNGINAVFQIHESNYIRITGLTINHSASGGISLGVLAGEDPVNNIRVDNCTISNSSGHAIKSKNGNNNITFEWNYLYDNFNNWTGAVKSTQETVSFENVTDFSINNNTLINNRAENIDMKGGCNGGYCCYNTINNTGTGILQKQVGGDYYGGPAIMLDARGVSHNISIFNNIIYGNASGISLNTETTGHYEYIYIYNNIINLTKPDDVTSLTYPEPLGISNTGFSGDLFHHIYIYNNVVHLGSNNNYNLIQIGHYSQDQINGTTIDEFYIYNNIFLTKYDGSSNFIGGHFLLPTDLNIGNNCYYRASGTYKNRWDETTYTNLTDWNFGEEAVYGNPQFVNSDNGNFNITATSPCINNGTDVNAPSTDFWGNSRVDTTDIGIHEYQTPPPPETYNTTIRTNGLEYFVWLGDNTTAVDCADIIDNSSGITFNSGEYISIWNKSGNYNNDWYVNGWWYEYHPYNDSGDNFDIHTYDIVKIYLTESGGDTQIDMVGNEDMSYSNSRSVSLTTSTAGKNYVGWTDNAATTLKDIADTHISTTLDSGEAIYYWNETNYVWNIYIVGFYEPSIDVYEDDVIMVAVSDAETLNIGGK